MRRQEGIRQAVSRSTDIEAAVAEVLAGIRQPGLGVAILYLDPSLDPRAVEAAVRNHWDGAPLIGCTGVPIFSPEGTGVPVAGLSLAAPRFQATVGVVGDLAEFENESCWRAMTMLRTQLNRQAPGPEGTTFGLVFIDCTLGREERVLNTISGALAGIELVGGAAGRHFTEPERWVLHQDRVLRDHAVVVLVRTNSPVRAFHTHHFRPSGARFVVTETDPATQRVLEIDGEPALPEYARLLGITPEAFRAGEFINNPCAFRIGDRYYIRSIMEVNDDDSLTFACRLDTGMTLSIMVPDRIDDRLASDLARVAQEIGEPDMVLGFECAYRRLALNDPELERSTTRIMNEYGVVGFGCYGECHNRLFLNHSLTGIAIAPT